MIISHKYRFIFVKTRKTAGTCVEAYLSQHCGDSDVLTPIHPPLGHVPDPVVTGCSAEMARRATGQRRRSPCGTG